MPRGVPKLGKAFDAALSHEPYTPKTTTLDSATEELLNAPAPTLLGEIPLTSQTVSPPETSPSTWVSPSGETVEFTPPPPPWETDPKYFKHNSDARRFLKCPDEVELRWLNPRVIDQEGFRDWQAVPAAGDKKFRLLNRQLARPDNTIRKGGPTGDILCWMWRSWLESKRRIYHERVKLQTQSAVDRHQEVRDKMRRGAFGPHVRDGGGMHPTHTIGDIRDRD